MFDSNGARFPEITEGFSSILETNDFHDSSNLKNWCLFEFQSREEEFDLDTKKFLRDAQQDFKTLTVQLQW